MCISVCKGFSQHTWNFSFSNICRGKLKKPVTQKGKEGDEKASSSESSSSDSNDEGDKKAPPKPNATQGEHSDGEESEHSVDWAMANLDLTEEIFFYNNVEPLELNKDFVPNIGSW